MAQSPVAIRKRIPQMFVGFLILGTTLAGCGSTDYSDHHFDTMAELSDAAADGGLDCGKDLLTPVEEDKVEESLAKYDWAQDGYGSSCVLMLFESGVKREEIVEKNLDPDEATLVGGNWAISGGQYSIEALAKEMGGELIQP
ncbi:hypothetical protein [Arthrobacter sp. zg-Y1171]|uniref:hypothetical protein n=1 Tax=Arthrobacter sp. zg-Y1171 TaxID=2964610 RepID=UPI0021073BB5|nr:hypothetical protein [Arthrobacter sp. zg-Y1171]MCQ1994366.1 hypothetical protein [Arthrobacter sp. zg-Y1171]UWX81543.1 hypothetical protein N2L00_14280 [Arthrobacter sp. zg-Y1171]